MTTLLRFPTRPGASRQRARRGCPGLPNYQGAHGGPQRYTARLALPDHRDAWLFGRFVDGVPDKQFLGRVRRGHELNDCAQALWRKGAHPNSELTLWWGAAPGVRTPERVQTTLICAASPEAFAAASYDALVQVGRQ